METIDSNYLYESFIAPYIGPEIVRERDLRSYGIDRYIGEKGTNVLRSICIMYFVIPGIILCILFFQAYMKYLEPYLPDFIDKPIAYLKNKFQYNALLRVMIESYMPICLATFIGISNMEGQNAVDKLTAVLSIMLVLYCLNLPIGMYRFLREFRHILHEKETKAAFYSLYLDVEYYKLQALPFNTY